MARFHIAKDGKPGVCKAETKACPLGAAAPHGEFANVEAATVWAEEIHAKNAGGVFADKPAASNSSLLPTDLSTLKGTIFEKAAEAELRSAYSHGGPYGKVYRDAPTYTVKDAEAIPAETWARLADEAEAAYVELDNKREAYAAAQRGSNERFPLVPRDMREADLNARRLKALAINARNAAYIAAEKKLATGEILRPGEILVDATFDEDGKLLGYGVAGHTTVDGVAARFSHASSKRGDSVYGVVAVKGLIERGQVIASSSRIEDARVLEASTAVNMAQDTPTAPAEHWSLGAGTAHGSVHGQALFDHKAQRGGGGFDSFIPEY